MVKKKTNESEENKEKNINEITDNKENKQPTPGEQVNLKGESPEDPQVTAEEATEGSAEQASDKVVPDRSVFEVKLAEMQDKYLRLSAEFDNYRKRTLREKIDISKYAAEELLRSILPLMDDFERALRHMDSTGDCTGIKEGIDIIYMKFSDFLVQQGVKEIETLDMEFNVELHDAVAQIPVEEEERKGKIVDVILKGYYLKDKVLRHSKVVVGE